MFSVVFSTYVLHVLHSSCVFVYGLISFHCGHSPPSTIYVWFVTMGEVLAVGHCENKQQYQEKRRSNGALLDTLFILSLYFLCAVEPLCRRLASGGLAGCVFGVERHGRCL